MMAQRIAEACLSGFAMRHKVTREEQLIRRGSSLARATLFPFVEEGIIQLKKMGHAQSDIRSRHRVEKGGGEARAESINAERQDAGKENITTSICDGERRHSFWVTGKTMLRKAISSAFLLRSRSCQDSIRVIPSLKRSMSANLPTPPRMPVPLIIDTDPGIDDILAILLALAHPEYARIEAITLNFGNTTLDHERKNILRLFAVLQKHAREDPSEPSRRRLIDAYLNDSAAPITLSSGAAGPLGGQTFSASYLCVLIGLFWNYSRFADFSL